MIDPTVTNNKGVENAEKNLEQAKHRLATEKKKANDARRRIENRHKYMMGGVVHKYFPECFSFEEGEMNEILKAALATQECRSVINAIKSRARSQAVKSAESDVSVMIRMDEVLICKALGDPNRMEIVKMLSDQEKCGCKILEKFDITQPTLSHHMKILVDSGLVNDRKEGKWHYYTINTDVMKEFCGFIKTLCDDTTGKCCKGGL